MTDAELEACARAAFVAHISTSLGDEGMAPYAGRAWDDYTPEKRAPWVAGVRAAILAWDQRPEVRRAFDDEVPRG